MVVQSTFDNKSPYLPENMKKSITLDDFVKIK